MPQKHHLGLHCLLQLKQSSEKEIIFYLEIITCEPAICIMDHPKFIVSNQKEESISALRLISFIESISEIQGGRADYNGVTNILYTFC